MREFLKKHKERITLIGVGLGFLFFIGGGLYLQKNYKRDKEPLALVTPLSVKLKTPQQQKEKGTVEPTAAATSYFLKPSPEELLEQLSSLKNLNEDVVEAKFSNLPVLWPAYFFTVRKTDDGRTSLLLDVSEDGFGVVIQSEVDVTSFPQLDALVSGEKVWIGGKITAIDPAGTGMVYLKIEQLTVGSDPPFPSSLQNTEE